MANEAPSRQRIGIPDWDTLIPEMREYLVPGPTDPETFGLLESSLKVALAFSELYWPPFVEFDGMVFAGADTPCPSAQDNIANWMTSPKGDKSAVEAMLNHRHLVDMSRGDKDEVTAERLRYLGKLLKDMWAAKLARDFPDKTFEVELYISDEEHLEDWQITFFQSRDKPERHQ